VDTALLLKIATKATRAAAAAAQDWVGKNDKEGADNAAVEAIRGVLQAAPFQTRIISGEGARDNSATFGMDEILGEGDTLIECVVDPIEATTACAEGTPNSFSVMALGAEGTFLAAPDLYMEKLVVNSDVPADAVYLDQPIEELLAAVAEAQQKTVETLNVAILDRPRHAQKIADLQEAGCLLELIPDGDVRAFWAVMDPENPLDLYLGIGGAPEAVLGNVAVTLMGGSFHGRFWPRSASESALLSDPTHLYTHADLVKAPAVLAATGITDGVYLKNGETLTLSPHSPFFQKNKV